MGLVVPESWVELEDRADWERVRKLGGFIVIYDDVNDGPVYHHRGCPYVTLRDFTEKVLDSRAEGRRPNGRYFWAASHKAAREGARPCEHGADPVNQ